MALSEASSEGIVQDFESARDALQDLINRLRSANASIELDNRDNQNVQAMIGATGLLSYMLAQEYSKWVTYNRARKAGW